MSGGKIDATMRCTHEQMTQLVNFKGTYSPEAYQLAMDSKVEGGPREMTGMSMSMKVDAKRVGECSAKAS
jgi:carboxypeptidase C (cathepsin A)